MALIAVGAVVAALAPPSAHAAASKRCYPRDDYGIASDTRVRVFAAEDPDYSARTVFNACALRSGRRFELGESYTDTNISFGVGPVDIAGLTVGFQAFGCISGPACDSYVQTLDLKTGRALRSQQGGDRRATDLVVTRSGTTAWIDRISERSRARVMRLDANGTSTLDDGPDVDSMSLALARTQRVYWKSGGQPRSDSLGTPPGSEPVDDAVAGHRRCFPRGSTATAASRSVRVYELPHENGDDINVYGCLLKSGRRILLSTAFMTHGVVNLPRINGSRVAFSRGDCSSGSSECGAAVQTVDLRTGRRLSTGFPNSFPSELELGPNGSVAWIESRPSAFPLYRTSYRVLTRVGDKVTELDAGDDIHSLALDGTRLYWTNAGSPRSAGLD